MSGLRREHSKVKCQNLAAQQCLYPWLSRPGRHRADCILYIRVALEPLRLHCVVHIRVFLPNRQLSATLLTGIWLCPAQCNYKCGCGSSGEKAPSSLRVTRSLGTNQSDLTPVHRMHAVEPLTSFHLPRRVLWAAAHFLPVCAGVSDLDEADEKWRE